MVHYTLGESLPLADEQDQTSTWRLVRQNPIGSTTWHPKNDNLLGTDLVYGGQSYYGTVDHTDNKWGVPFTFGRPAQGSNNRYSYPDEMFICSADFSQWVRLSISSFALSADAAILVAVKETNLNRAPHSVYLWRRFGHHEGPDPLISNHPNPITTELQDKHMLYAENGSVGFDTQKGSLVFVRTTPT